MALDTVTWAFLKFDRRHNTILKLTGEIKKKSKKSRDREHFLKLTATLDYFKIDRKISKIATGDITIS